MKSKDKETRTRVGQHQKMIYLTYLFLALAFTGMIIINYYAYQTTISMSNVYTSMANASIKIKLNITDSNLLFREISSGQSTKDMNDVWSLLKKAQEFASPLSDIGEKQALIDKIDLFKKVLVKCYTAKEVTPQQRIALQQEYQKSLNELMAQIDQVDSVLKDMVDKQMKTLKNLHRALIGNFIVVIFFTFFVFHRYVKKRKVAENELSNIKDTLDTVLNSLDSMIIAIDAEDIVIQWNNASEKYFSIPKEEAMDHTLWGVLPWLREYQQKITAVIQSKKPKVMFRESIPEFKNRYFNIAIHYTEGISGAVIRFDDVTRQALQEEQLRQAQKMEVVENLVGGLAHDFNNVLGAITGTISMMRYSLKDSQSGQNEDIKANIDVIESSTERAVVMVQQLLTLSKKHELDLQPTDLNQSVKHVINICANTFDKRIDLVAELFDLKVMTLADPVQIELVLLNLCDNAAQAMTAMRREGEPQGGTLTISIDRIFPDKKYRDTHPDAKEASYWCINISDTGIGMDRNTIMKIFDPFFTTKGQSEGTGLGLTMVNDVIKQHKGYMEVESDLGKGTTFKLFIPELVKEMEEDEEETKSEDKEQIPVGSGTVLVVDDEAVMRKTAQGILEKLGYQVIFAENGEEAVNIFKEKHEEILITLLDMAMPKKSGKEAYVEMKEIQPDLKVLLISGFEKDERIQQVLDMGVNAFIKKPYSMVTLAQEIKKYTENNS